MGLQSLTLECIARVFSLKNSLEKLISISWVMLTYIVLVKKWEKHTLKGSSSEFHKSLATWPKSRSDSQNLPWQETVQIPACASYTNFCGVSTREPVTNSRSSQIFTKLSHSTLILNPTKMQGNDWTKIQSNLIWN